MSKATIAIIAASVLIIGAILGFGALSTQHNQQQADQIQQYAMEQTIKKQREEKLAQMEAEQQADREKEEQPEKQTETTAEEKAEEQNTKQETAAQEKKQETISEQEKTSPETVIQGADGQKHPALSNTSPIPPENACDISLEDCE